MYCLKIDFCKFPGQKRVGMLSGYFGSSWKLADAIFAPRNCFLGEEDEGIATIYKIRSTIGAIIIIYVAIRYHHIHGISEASGAIYNNMNWTVFVGLLSIVPAAAAIMAYTKRGKRKEALLQMRFPIFALGGWLVMTQVFVLVERLLTYAGGSAMIGLLLSLVALIWVLWFLSFTIRTFYLLVTGFCRLGDGHPLLPAAIGSIAAWAPAIKGLLAVGGDEPEPAALTLMLLIGGPVSITLLGAYEVQRLKQKYPDEFPFRNGPHTP
jgi:hypothetical protein